MGDLLPKVSFDPWPCRQELWSLLLFACHAVVSRLIGSGPEGDEVLLNTGGPLFFCPFAGLFIRPFIRLFDRLLVPPGPLRHEICPLRPDICPLRDEGLGAEI